MLLLLIATKGSAQFGNLKTRSKKDRNDQRTGKIRAKTATGRRTLKPMKHRTKMSPMSKTKSSTGQRSTGIEMVEIDFSSQPFKPAVAWYSLLSDNCLYFNNVNGEFKYNNLHVSFLPAKTKDGRDKRLQDLQQTFLLHWKWKFWCKNNVTKAKLLYQADDDIVPFHTMGGRNKPGYDWSAKLTEGSYECRFKIGGVPFTFPFSVIKVANVDLYAPGAFLYFCEDPGRNGW